MSGFKNFALAGAGNLGQHVVKALLQLKKNGTVNVVKVLTRSSANLPTELSDLGASFVEVNYEDPESLKNALTGIDVVISTLGAPALTTQTQLADASSAAGVKLFVPSEFGGKMDGNMGHPVFATKNTLRQHLRDKGLPFTIFCTGLFPDFVLKSSFAFDFINKKVAFGGSGDEPISWTSMPDVARYVAHVLTALPKNELEWRTFRIEGDRHSFNSLISEYEKRTGATIKVSKRSRAELEAALKENPYDFVSFLFLDWDLGGGACGTPDEVTKGVWPEWDPRKALDVAIEGAA